MERAGAAVAAEAARMARTRGRIAILCGPAEMAAMASSRRGCYRLGLSRRAVLARRLRDFARRSGARGGALRGRRRPGEAFDRPAPIS